MIAILAKGDWIGWGVTVAIGVFGFVLGPTLAAGIAGATTATVLAQAIVNEGLRNLAAGANPMLLKRGIEKGVDAIVDVPNSAVGLSINTLLRGTKMTFLASSTASSDLTGKACSPNTIHWAYDTWMLANGTGNAIVKTGGDSWFFLTADYAFGHALERDTGEVVEKSGAAKSQRPGRFRPLEGGYILRFFGQPNTGTGDFQGGLAEHLYLNNGPLRELRCSAATVAL